MNLYNTASIRGGFITKHIDTDQRKEIASFFGGYNIFDNLDVGSCYTNGDSNALFIDQLELSKICLIASAKFGLDFKYKEMNFKKINIEKEGTTRHEVNSYDDVFKVLKIHHQTSAFSLAKKEKKELQRVQRNKRFQEMSNMDRDFLSGKIVSVDFEYNPGTNKKHHLNTIFEFGVSTYENGKIRNHHYLIQENYVNKKTNPSLQFKFDFGETKIISMDEIIPTFQKHLRGANYLLFHEYSADYGILKENGSSIEDISNNYGMTLPEGVAPKKCEIIDTQPFFKKHFKETLKEKEPLSLKRLLAAFGIQGESLHNSGNDAVYTMQVFLKMYDAYKEKNENKLEDSGKKNTRRIKPTA